VPAALFYVELDFEIVVGGYGSDRYLVVQKQILGQLLRKEGQS
jgi:hypothetical protein